MKYHVIAIDCDDVLVGTAPLVINNYNETYGTHLELQDMYSNNSTQWNAYYATAIARVEAYLESDEYRTTVPFHDAIETVQTLAKHYELHMVTGRTQLLEAATTEMLQKYFPNLFKSLEFTGLHDGVRRSKSDVCRQLNVDLFIDDHLGHALPVAASGIDVLLFGEYPWSQTTEPLPDNIRRVRDWNDVAQVLLTDRPDV